jgi:ABC-type transport system involved in cytochrome bd biosynthesis fused ATPase/permease subunit
MHVALEVYKDTEVIFLSLFLCICGDIIIFFFSKKNMVLMKLMAPLILLTMQVSTHMATDEIKQK